jgi:hypothetical protein
MLFGLLLGLLLMIPLVKADGEYRVSGTVYDITNNTVLPDAYVSLTEFKKFAEIKTLIVRVNVISYENIEVTINDELVQVVNVVATDSMLNIVVVYGNCRIHISVKKRIAIYQFKIVWTGTETYVDLTNEYGRFGFDNLKKAKYVLKVSKDGYCDYTMYFELLENLDLTVYLMRLQLTYTVSGTAYDENFKPLSGVNIRLDNYRSISDDVGYYRIDDVVPGDYMFIAEKENYYTYVCKLTVNSNVNKDVYMKHIVPRPAYNICGYVRDERGNLLDNIKIMLDNLSTYAVNGYYEFTGLDKGIYHLYCCENGYQPFEMTVDVNKSMWIDVVLQYATAMLDIELRDQRGQVLYIDISIDNKIYKPGKIVLPRGYHTIVIDDENHMRYERIINLCYDVIINIEMKDAYDVTLNVFTYENGYISTIREIEAVSERGDVRRGTNKLVDLYPGKWTVLGYAFEVNSCDSLTILDNKVVSKVYGTIKPENVYVRVTLISLDNENIIENFVTVNNYMIDWIPVGKYMITFENEKYVTEKIMFALTHKPKEINVELMPLTLWGQLSRPQKLTIVSAAILLLMMGAVGIRKWR